MGALMAAFTGSTPTRTTAPAASILAMLILITPIIMDIGILMTAIITWIEGIGVVVTTGTRSIIGTSKGAEV